MRWWQWLILTALLTIALYLLVLLMDSLGSVN